MRYFSKNKKWAWKAALITLGVAASFFLCLASVARDSYFSPILMCLMVLYVSLMIRPRGTAREENQYLLWVLLAVSTITWVGIEAWSGSGFNETPDGLKMQMIRLFFNYVIVLAIFILFVTATGRMRSGLKGGIIFMNAVGLANAVIYQFKGGLLLPADLAAFGTAMKVAGGYTLSVSPNMVCAILMMYCAWSCANSVPERDDRFLPKKKNEGRAARLTGLVIGAAMLLSFFVFDSENYYYAWWKEDNGYPYNLVINTKLLKVSKPKGYEADDIPSIIGQGGDTVILKNYNADEAIKNAFPEYYQQYGAKPVIIGIMNESFTDLSVVGDIETDQEIFSYIDSMSENTIKGNLYTEIYGGGTADSEYTFLTGNSTLLFAENARAYQNYVKKDNSSLALSLKNQGYDTYALHPENPKNWNREKVYPMIGFDHFASGGEDRESANGNDYFGQEIVRDKYTSDAATYQYIEEIYDQIDRPFFAFDVTMQNHGNYLQSYNNLDPVKITNLGQEYPMADQFVSLIKRSDEAYGDLIEHFKSADRPVVIIMFGDHQPKLDEGFYDALSGTPISEWSPEQSQNQQITPFIIWANYDLPETTFDEMSINYLSTLFIQCTGTEMTPYQHYLAWLYEKYPVINKKGLIDKDGNYLSYSDLDGEDQKIIQDYRYVLYNNIIDVKHRTADLYGILPENNAAQPVEEEKKES